MSFLMKVDLLHWILYLHFFLVFGKAQNTKNPTKIEKKPAILDSENYSDWSEYYDGTVDDTNGVEVERLEPKQYAQLIEKLRNSWELPSSYLEKRGYLNKREIKPQSEFIREEPNTIPHQFSEKNPYTNETTVTTVLPADSPRKISKNPTTGYTRINLAEERDTTEKPGFFQNIKLKFSNLFSRNKTDSSPSFTDAFPESLDAKISQTKKENSNEFYSFQYGDSWLQPTDLNKNTNLEDEYQNNFVKWRTKKSTNSNRNQIHTEADSTNIKENLQNLSDSDVELIKNFLKCFRASKTATKFTSNSVHLVQKENDTMKKFTPVTPVALSELDMNNHGNLKVVISVPNDRNQTVNEAKVEISDSKGSVLNETNPGIEEIKVNFNIGNETETGCVNRSCNQFEVKLKFLAHLHHQVYEVGKRPYKPVDLQKIAQMIDEVRYNSGMKIISGSEDNSSAGIDASYYESTTSFDFNLNAESFTSSTSKFGTDPNSGAGASASKNFKRSFSENFLNFGNSFDPDDQEAQLDDLKTKRKRNAYVDQNIDHVLSDMTSSLKKFSKNGKSSLSLDDYYYDDPENGVHEKKRENVVGKAQRVDTRRLKTEKKKKKQKKKKLWNFSSTEKQDDSNPEHSHLNLLGERPTIQEVQDNSYHKIKEELLDTTKTANADSSYSDFSELNDIKYQLNSDQEEAIDKFVQSLNSPPEVFNFNVDKFIQERNSKAKFDSLNVPSSKAFYEFLATPNVEKQDVPFIEKEPSTVPFIQKDDIFQPVEDIKREKGLLEKRDTLRQYIKGVSQHILGTDIQAITDSKKDHTHCNNSPQPEAENNDSWNVRGLEDRDPIPSSIENDDEFVDKFYLLNDGNPNFFGSKKPMIENPVLMDAKNVNIDLDLDRKFRGLKILESREFKSGNQTKNSHNLMKENNFPAEDDMLGGIPI